MYTFTSFNSAYQCKHCFVNEIENQALNFFLLIFDHEMFDLKEANYAKKKKKSVRGRKNRGNRASNFRCRIIFMGNREALEGRSRWG